MQNFLKNLFGKKQRANVPPSGDGGAPAHLLAELETKITQLLPLLDDPSKKKLQEVLQGFQEDKLKAAVDAFVGFTQSGTSVPELENMGILLAAQGNQLLIQQKDGLLDKQMVRQRKAALLKSLTGFLGNLHQFLTKRG